MNRHSCHSMLGVLVVELSLLASGPALAQPLDPFDFASLGDLNLAGGAFTIDTDALTITGPGVNFMGIADDQNGAADYLNGVWIPGSMGVPELAVFAFDEIDIQSTATITVTGTRALAFVTHGSAVIDTTIDLSGESVPAPAMIGDEAPAGVGRVGGFSGGFAAFGMPPEDGDGPGAGTGASVVGNSAGFGGPGLRNAQPVGGPAYGDLVNGPLQGGSGGGSVENVGLGGAAGGGALEISAAGAVTLGSNGNLIVAGGTTEALETITDVGGGAGSGGAIRIRGQSVDLLGSVDARGNNAAFPAAPTSDAGGGRVAMFGSNQLFDFIVGQTSTSSISTSNINVEGGCLPSGTGCNALARGLISISPQVTSIPSGESLTLGDVTDLSDADRRLELVHRNIRVQPGGAAVVPAEGYVNHAAIELFPGGSTIASPGTLDNRGELSGTGTVDAPLDNNSGGTIDAINDTLTFAAAVTNSPGAQINAIGSTLNFDAGLTNSGDLNLITSTINGTVTSSAASIATSGTATFTGAFTGGSDFTGDGHVTFTGGYSPGDSPGVVIFENHSVTFDSAGVLTIEIGGTDNSDPENPQFDQMIINGTTNLAGTLRVELIDLGGGVFEPSAGDSFPFMTAAFTSPFDAFDFPALPGGLQWRVNPGDATIFLEVIAQLIGDYNDDGTVNAADYTVWRDNLGLGVTLPNDVTPGSVDQSDYDEWKNNFGATTGAGAGSSPTPEPSTLILLTFAVGTLIVTNRREVDIAWRTLDFVGSAV